MHKNPIVGKSQKHPMSWLKHLRWKIYRSAKQVFAGKPRTMSRTCSKIVQMPDREKRKGSRAHSLFNEERPTTRHRWTEEFSLIELLVVIAIIALLLSVLMPALNKANNQAKSAVCKSNLKQLGTATFIYASDYNNWLPVAFTTSTVTGEAYLPGLWKFEIAAYLGIGITPSFSSAEPGIANGVFRCPNWNITLTAKTFEGGYGMNGWWGNGMGECEKYRRKANAAKLPVETILYGDTADWYIGAFSHGWRYAVLYRASATGDGGVPLVGNRHNLGINFLCVDGHVDWMSQHYLRRGRNNDIDWFYRCDK